MIIGALLFFMSASLWGVGGKGGIHSPITEMFASLQLAVIILSLLFGYSFQKIKSRKLPPFYWETSFWTLTWNLILTLVILTLLQIIPSNIHTYHYILSFNNNFLEADANTASSLIFALLAGYYIIGIPVSHFLLNHQSSKIQLE